MMYHDPRNFDHLSLRARADARRERLSKKGLASYPVLGIVLILPILGIVRGTRFAWNRWLRGAVGSRLRRRPAASADYMYKPDVKRAKD